MHTGDFVMLTSVHHEEVCTFILIMLKEGYYSIPRYSTDFYLPAVKLLMDVLYAL